MSFDYIRKACDFANSELLNSEFAVTATVFIVAEEVGGDAIEVEYGEVLDARQSGVFDKRYPDGLLGYYRIKVIPIEKTGLRVGTGQEFKQTPYSSIEPYDFWVSCLRKDVIITRNNKTFFDYADNIQIGGNVYTLKGVITDSFGFEDVVHLFLVKESSI
ncbi:hypothetical protein M0R04_05770 [Candidatus Dojkabacteria bacterium]|jgi:hypothetical protein|nr:hypothetical protein [Candidatus Dojkabacteria bacterium]